MSDGMNALIARGLPQIDPAGDYLKLQALQQAQQQRQLEMQQARELQPLRVQAYQQQAQAQQMELEQTQREQASQQAWQDAWNDPANEGDPHKVLLSTLRTGKMTGKHYTEAMTALTTAEKEKAAAAKSKADLAALRNTFDAEGSAGIAAAGYGLNPFLAHLGHMEQAGYMTKAEADAELAKAKADPNYIRDYVSQGIARSTAVQEGVTKTREAERARQKEQVLEQVDDVTDQAGWDRLLKSNPLIALPSVWKPDAAAMVKRRLGVPVEKQPEYVIKQAEAAGITDPDRLKKAKAQIDASIDPSKGPVYAYENNLATQAVTGIIARGGTAKEVEAAIKDSADRIGKHESTVAAATDPAIQAQKVREATAIASATAPIHAQAQVNAEVNRAKNSPEAFGSIINPRERAAAQTNYEKDSKEYADKVSAARQLQDFVAAAQSGNKAAPGMIPIQEVKQLLNRVNRQELESVSSAAGSLWDRIQGKVGGLTEGQSIPPDVLNDINSLAGTMENAARRGYEFKVNVTNQTYGSKAKPIQLGAPAPAGGQAASAPVPANVAAALKNAGPGIHTLSNGTKWMKDASGKITPQ
jgi:hypothetical protein